VGKAAQPFYAAVYCTALCMRWFCKQIHKHKEGREENHKKAVSYIVQYKTVGNNFENF